MDVVSVIVPKFGDPRQRFRFISIPLRSSGAEVEVPDVRTWRGLLSAARLLERRRSGFIILVGVGLKPLMLGFVAWMFKVKVVVRLGGDPRHNARTAFMAAFRSVRLRAAGRAVSRLVSLPLLFALTRDIVVVHPSLIQPLQLQTASTTRFHVVPQPMFGESEARSPGLDGKTNLLTVTNLGYPQKAEGVVRLITQLVRFAADYHGEMVFRVAGDGQFRSKVEQALTLLRLPANLSVEMLGFQADIEEEYRRADLFLYHSEYDATPNVLLEAKRFGLPVLVNDFPPFRTIVKDGVSGLIYADGSGFNSALRRLIDGPELCRRLAEGGLVELREEYSENAVGQAWLNVLYGMLRNSPDALDARQWRHRG